MLILFVFTRGPQMGTKILVHHAKDMFQAMETIRKEIPMTAVQSDTHTQVVADVFEYNDFEVLHIRRELYAEGEEPTYDYTFCTKAEPL